MNSSPINFTNSSSYHVGEHKISRPTASQEHPVTTNVTYMQGLCHKDDKYFLKL